MTWFRLGGRGRFLYRPHNEQQLASLIRRARQENVPIKFLGGGANVLVRDGGFDGVVVRLDHPAFRRADFTDERVRVGAGTDLMPFARNCSSRGLSGLEAMAGIPGTIGGAVCMNAGGQWGEFGDVVNEVRLMNSDGGVETWDRRRVGFGYRSTGIGDRLVLSVELNLTRDDPVVVERRHAEHMNQKQRTQPLADKSAGCIFRNPSGQSAGALIDRAGLKGTRIGGASVSTRHANFIVAGASASASDVLRLIDRIRDRVRAAFDTELETEIDIW